MTYLNEKIVELLQYRIEQEELSARIYKAMSSWLSINGYLGASALWNNYSKEEVAHSEVVYKYLLDLNVLPEVPTLYQPKIEFDSFEQIIHESLKHEMDITNQCNELAKACSEGNDFMTLKLAQWFLSEQTEELNKTQTWVDKLTAFGHSEEALRLLDNEMLELAK